MNSVNVIYERSGLFHDVIIIIIIVSFSDKNVVLTYLRNNKRVENFLALYFTGCFELDKRERKRKSK